MTKERTILGIDPGTNLMGFGVVRASGAGKAEYVDMGVLDLRKFKDPYGKLRRIHEFTSELCSRYAPDDLAIESPFYGKNAQVIFKLGRAQGAAIVAAAEAGASVSEYAPRKAKISICGNGAASKEQVALMVSKTLGVSIREEHLDATDALAIAMAHYYEISSPLGAVKTSGSWVKFIEDNPGRVK